MTPARLQPTRILLSLAALPRPAPGQRTRVTAGLPSAPWGLQLCSTGPRGLQVSVAAPPQRDQLLLPLTPDNSLIVGASLYRYPSARAATQAWSALQSQLGRCSGTVAGPGGLTSRLSHGKQPLTWVENQQRSGTSVGSDAERAALQTLAARLGSRLAGL